MSYRTNRMLFTASKLAIWVSLIAILIYIIASILFYSIGYEHFSLLQRAIFSNPLVYIIPILLGLGLVGARSFREEEGWQTRKSSHRVTKSYRAFGAILGVCLVGIILYYVVSNTSDGKENLLANSGSENAPSNNNVSTNSEEVNEPKEDDAITNATPAVEEEPVKDSVIIPPAKSTVVETSQKEPARAGSSNNSFELKYKVVSKAYLYSEPNINTRRNAFINPNSSYSTLYPKQEKNNFVYVVFTDKKGHTTAGWLNKKDLKPVNELVYNSEK